MTKKKKINRSKKSDRKFIPFKNEILSTHSFEEVKSIEDQERERANKFARETCDKIDDFVKECRMETDMTYYHFLFHLKQRLIHRVSYNLFKFADKSSTDEVIENMAKYLNENSPELKLDSINNTIQ